MRKILLFLLFFTGWSASGQNKQLLYNFDDLPQNLMNNPGSEATFDRHAGIPLFSQIHVSAGSSGVNLYDIFQEAEGSINHRIRDAISNMSNRDFFVINQQLELLSVGWRGKSGDYYSAGLYEEADAFAYFPRDLAALAYEGNQNYRNQTFKFSDVAFTGELLSVFHFGISKSHSRDLTLGFRAKLYSSAVNIRSVGNRGSFKTITSSGSSDTYRPVLNQMDIAIQTAGLNSLSDTNIDSRSRRKLLTRNAFFSGNYGVGVDLGFTHYLTDQWRLTGSLLDLGMIVHTQDVENSHYFGNYQSPGGELTFFETREEPLDNLDEIREDLEDYFVEERSYDPYTSMRPLKLNASIDFGFSEDLKPCNYRNPSGRRRYYNYVGLQLFSMKRPQGFVHAATVSFDKKFTDSFRGKVTYTADSFSFSNIGLLISTKINSFNFYIAADNLLDYSNLAKANNTSLQIGFQFMFDHG